MNRNHFLIGATLYLSFLLFACGQGNKEEPETDTESDENVISKESSIVEEDNAFNIAEDSIPRYRPGRYVKKTTNGTFILLIHPVSANKCRFVFDTGIGTPCYAKLAGVIELNDKGRATYSDNSCKALDFDFTDEGISVKEFECSQFHSPSCSMDGFYKSVDPDRFEKIDAKAMVDRFQKEDGLFDFYAVFTEPFWSIYIKEDIIYFQGSEDPLELFEASALFDPEAESQIIYFEKNKENWALRIEKGEGSDGMSEITYPYKAILNNNFHGGGGRSRARERIQ